MATKLLLLVLIVLVLSALFYLLLLILNKNKNKEPKMNELNYSKDYFYNKLKDKEVEQTKIKENLISINDEIENYKKGYEKGIFIEKNKEIYNLLKNLYSDLFNWKRKKNYPINENEVDFFLEDIVKTLASLNVQVIAPKYGDKYDIRSMKIADTKHNFDLDDDLVLETWNVGYLLKSNGIEKVLQQATVVINKKRG